jgi:hypothetical protein
MQRVFLAVTVAMLCACGGNGGTASGGVNVVPATAQPTASPTAAPGQGATAVLTLVVPAETSQTQTQTFGRRPHYISPSSNSVSFAQLGGPVTIASIAPGSANCAAGTGGTRTCTVSVSATAGTNQSFTIKTYAGTTGSGTPLSAVVLIATIVPLARNTLSATLNGVVKTISIATAQTTLDYGDPGSTAVVVNALDASGNTIVGPGVYADANGTPLAIALTDGDTSKSSSLSAASVAKPGTAVTLDYTGGAATGATITGSAPGATPGSATVTFRCGAAPATTALYVSNFDAPGNGTVTYGVSRYATTATGANPAPAGGYPLPNGFFPTIAVDSVGSTFVTYYDSTDTTEAIGQFCPDATGTPPPFRSFAPAHPSEGDIALDGSNDVYVANGGAELDEYPAGAGSPGFVTKTSATTAAKRTITGSNTGMYFATGLAVKSDGTAYVGNYGQITEYSAAANGNVLPSLKITRTAAGLLGALDTAVDAAGNVYALYFADNQSAVTDLTNPYGPYAVAEYPAGATTPSRIISGPATQLGTYFGAAGTHDTVLHFDNEPEMTVDPRGTIYVASTVFTAQGAGETTEVEVAEFDQGVNGNTAPTRTIDVNTAINGYGVRPLALAADSNHDVYLGDENGFGVLEFNASGAYTNEISPSANGLGIVTGLALDASANLVLQSIQYTTASSTTVGITGLLVYPPGAGSATPPTRSVTNGNTIQAYEDNTGNNRIALDASGHVYEVTNLFEEAAEPTLFYANEVSEFSTAAANGAAPIATFTGALGALDAQHGIGLDARGNIYVSSYQANAVREYAAGTTGANATASAAYSDYGSSTLDANGLTLDTAGSLYGVSCDSDSVDVYPSGSAAPARTLVGTRTGLLCPSSVTVDSTGTIYVLDNAGVHAFASTASGNVPPLRTFSTTYEPAFVGTFFFDIAAGPGSPGVQTNSAPFAMTAQSGASQKIAASAPMMRRGRFATGCARELGEAKPIRTSRPRTTPRSLYDRRVSCR